MMKNIIADNINAEFATRKIVKQKIFFFAFFNEFSRLTNLWPKKVRSDLTLVSFLSVEEFKANSSTFKGVIESNSFVSEVVKFAASMKFCVSLFWFLVSIGGGN